MTSALVIASILSVPLLILGAVLTMAFLPSDPVICRLGGLKWTRKQFCHNFLLTGAIGSGKTVALNNILDQLFKHVPGWGGLFLDNKGNAHHSLLSAAERNGRLNDVIIVEVSASPTYPAQRLNLFTAIGPEITAKAFAEMTHFGSERSKHSAFFKQQTATHLARAIEFFQWAKRPLTAEAVRSFLTSDSVLRYEVDYLRQRSDKEAKAFYSHWIDSYLSQPHEQRGGVFSSIANALHPLTSPLIANVFASGDHDTFSFKDIDNGKIICVLIPQSYPVERSAINLFCKQLFFYHASERYDRQKPGQKEPNLLVMFCDEAQKSTTEVDNNFLDSLRECGCAFIAASQDECSFVPNLGPDVAKTIIGKFRNRIIFRSESWESATRSSDLFGRRKTVEYSNNYGTTGSSTNRSWKHSPVLAPEHFRNLADHRCAILHTSNKFKARVKLPFLP